MTAIDLRARAQAQARALRQLRLWRLRLSPRAAWALAIGSSALLVGMVVLWLVLATRTALLSKQLEDLEQQDQQLVEQINNKWTAIGAQTTQQRMEERARAAGYHPADKMEYLVEATAAVSSTTPLTAASATSSTVPLTATTLTTTLTAPSEVSPTHGLTQTATD